MRNQVIENLRGLCLLGVIAIHIGSLALQPGNFPLYISLEVLSRYSVPAFFFISGYGLFCRRLPDPSPKEPGLPAALAAGYRPYLGQRLLRCGLPYLCWSLLYLAYFALILPPGSVSFAPGHLATVLLFGLACYHLYFMVILLWFYALLPLWQRLLAVLCRLGLPLGLGLLFAAQLAFNWWTCHPGLDSSRWPSLARDFFTYRLNYLPLHYLFVFMLGAAAALYWQPCCRYLKKYALLVCLFFVAGSGWDVYSCYAAMVHRHYTLVEVANTYHQLSPQGLLYTAAALPFFCLCLLYLEKASPTNRLAALLHRAIALLGSYSMLLYLVHPLVLDWLTSFYHRWGIVMTVKRVCCSYLAVLLGSLLLSWLLRRLCRRSSLLGLLLTGRP